MTITERIDTNDQVEGAEKLFFPTNVQCQIFHQFLIVCNVKAQFRCQIRCKKALGFLPRGLYQAWRKIRTKSTVHADSFRLQKRNQASDVHSSTASELQKTKRPCRRGSHIRSNGVQVNTCVVMLKKITDPVAGG